MTKGRRTIQFASLDAEWDRIQCVQCAHHLSFALPTPKRARSGG